MSASEKPALKLNDYYLEFAAGKIDRRTLMLKASGLGLSAAAVTTFLRGVPASAQDASPVATAARKSITREEYKAALASWWSTKEEPANTGGAVIMGEIESANLTTFNMMLSDNSPTNPILNLVYETLVGSSPIDGQYVPALADYWEIAEDGKTYTFHLHEGVTWHDGTPFTADDVLFSMDAQADPATGSAYTSSFTSYVASWEKVDDLTVKVTATDVFAEVVFHGNAYCPIVAKHIWENVPHDQWAADGGSNGSDPSRVVGTGPFKFESTSEGEGTSTFVKNPDYYDDVAVIDTFIFSTRGDEVAAIEALRAGEIDFYENVPPTDVATLQAPDQGTDVKLYDSYSFSWYGYQLDPAKTTLFQDVKTRQALFYALDRQSMVDNIMLGYAEVAQGTQPILSPAYDPEAITTKYTFDVEKAKSLLAEAGWADSDGDGILEKDGQPLSFQIMYGSGSPTSDQIVAFVQDSWKAIGVDAQPNPVDFGAVLVPALTENFDFQMVFLGFNWDPTGDQSAMFSTDAYGAGFNAMKYSNPAVDEKWDAAGKELDNEKRRQLLIEATNMVNEDLPIGCLWFRKDRTGYQTRIHNFEPNGNGGLVWSLPWVWVE
jgi:peptide/nickel transport system substrate-binding protein